MELKRWLEEIKEKGNLALEFGKLRVKKATLERRISKFHCRLGERVDYLFKLEKNVMEDDIVKGFIEEIRNIEKEIEEIEKKMELLKVEKAKEDSEGEETKGEK